MAPVRQLKDISKLPKLPKRPKPIPDEELVAKIIAGDQRPYTPLYNRYVDKLIRYYIRVLGDEEEAWDALQETWIKVFEKLRDKDYSEKQLFKEWLWTIAYGTAMDRLRSAIRRRKLNGFLLRMSMDTLVMDAEEYYGVSKEELRECVKGLPLQMMYIIYAHYYWGHTFKEIAESLDRTSGAIRNSHSRALEKMRSLLGVKSEELRVKSEELRVKSEELRVKSEEGETEQKKEKEEQKTLNLNRKAVFKNISEPVKRNEGEKR